MHIAGALLSLWAGSYTLAWARTLWKDGNKVGAFWSVLLAFVSTGASLWYFYRHNFYP